MLLLVQTKSAGSAGQKGGSLRFTAETFTEDAMVPDPEVARGSALGSSAGRSKPSSIA